MTTIAIIGLGNMGKGLARRLAGKADLFLASRAFNAATAFAATLPGGATVLDQDAAIARVDIVVLALPFDAAVAAAANPALAGKVVVDITNPVKADFSGLTIGHTTSAAEQIQAAAPTAKIVKAFNTIFAEVLDLPTSQTADVPIFVAGNDEAAVAAVVDIAQLAGFATETAGGLDAARLLEPLGMLNIRFGYGLGHGTAIAPKWTKLSV